MRNAITLFLVALSSGATAWAQPATTYKVKETTHVIPPDDRSWFFRADSSTDVPLKGATGFGLSAGHFGNEMFLDAGFRVYSMHYGAVFVPQSGIIDNALDTNTEVGRPRNSADTGSAFTVGPGVGFMFKLFGSEKWVQSGRFGLSYMHYQDSTNNQGFSGASANFHAEVAYRISDELMIAPGVSYEVGYVTRTSIEDADAQIPSSRFLPLAWWSWQLSFYFWAF